jgi:hypothetical protein
MGQVYESTLHGLRLLKSFELAHLFTRPPYFLSLYSPSIPNINVMYFFTQGTSNDRGDLAASVKSAE